MHPLRLAKGPSPPYINRPRFTFAVRFHYVEKKNIFPSYLEIQRVKNHTPLDKARFSSYIVSDVPSCALAGISDVRG
jgi:hypothetical protein